jgi:hypothetical protein
MHFHKGEGIYPIFSVELMIERIYFILSNEHCGVRENRKAGSPQRLKSINRSPSHRTGKQTDHTKE